MKTDFFSEKTATTTNASEEGAILFMNLYKNLHEYFIKKEVCFMDIKILQVVLYNISYI